MRKLFSLLLSVVLTLTMFGVISVTASAASVLDAEFVDSLFNIQKDGGVKGDGSDETAALSAAFNKAVAAGKQAIYFPAGTYYINAKLSTPNTVEFVFAQGAVLKIGAKGNLRMYASIVAGDYQIFDFNDKAKTGGLNGSCVGNPMWFGAKGDGKTDDTKAIQRAVDMFQEVHFPYTTDGYLFSDILIDHAARLVGADREKKVKWIAAKGTEKLITVQTSYVDIFSFEIEMKKAASATTFFFNTKSAGTEQNHLEDIDVYHAKTAVTDQGTQMMISTEFLNFNCFAGTGTAFLCKNMWGFIFLTNVVIDYSESAKMNFSAITIENNAGMVLNGVDIIGNDISTADAHGVWTKESQAMWFQHVTVKNVGGSAFQNNGHVNWHIYYYDCHAENVGGYAFEMKDESSWLQYAHCSAKNTKGFLLIGKGVQLSDIVISETKGNGITSSTENAVFTDVEINKSSGYGMEATGDASVYINITGTGNGKDLIKVSGEGSGVTTF